MRVLRWIALVPAAIAAWYVAFFAGLHLLSIVDSYCPPELVVSGTCTADWYPTAEQIVICVGVGLSAFLVILTTAIVAPSHKVLFSRIALGVGVLVAAVMGIAAGAYYELASAVLVGLGSLLVVTAWLRSPRSKSGTVA